MECWTLGNNWVPQEFEDLRLSALGSVQSAKARGYDIRKSPQGKDYVYGLLKAASKFKLAKSISDVQYVDYAERTRVHYTAQIKITAAFVAFEAYSRLRNNRRWHSLADVISGNYLVEASEIRKSISLKSLTELRNFMDRQALQDRLDNFSNGNLQEVFSVACALRNGFAHGLYGSRGQFYRASLKLRPLILKAIKEDCVSEIGAI